MKNLVITLVLLLSAITAKAQEETVTITVTIDNILNDNGTVLVSLHNNDTFMKGPGLFDLKENAKTKKILLTFENVKPGAYAIMVLHDENDNNRMDFEANGMPKENYGVSGNTMAFGPPNFTDSKFEVTNEDVELTIRF